MNDVTSFDSSSSYSLSLVDAIDTLATLGNTTEFARVYQLIQHLDIERDINVSVFETNIRGERRHLPAMEIEE